ncbi:MAG: hypothetical protein JWL73_2241 [Actinomycetia bacterium]|nr:hypothetical protein [Actinomycetes bacterium]
MPTTPQTGPTKAEQRRFRLRRARAVTAALSVVATVTLGIVLATTDPTRAATPTASSPASPSTPSPSTPSPSSPSPDLGSPPANSGGPFSSGGSGNDFSNGGGGSGANTQTHGS